ncbi:MAG: 4-diphosphocytidyl-2C-methyl-D-erythritol kinase [Alphaproteobacteria bacterium]|nr:MAG: 4-diphosphocytidyl-2C-methyl-D-erythritol kinase [Alphaproteobacteria bacterium]
MKFATFTLADARGAVLAHALQLPDGRLKKGTVLTEAELARIGAAGIETVIAARLEAADIGEDAAATRLGQALASPDIRAEAAATGRVNLYALADGLFTADHAAVDAINGADPGITLATLDHLTPVNAGRLVATVKIIPYAVAGAALDRALAIAGAPVIGIERYRPRRVGVVATKLPSLKASVMDKTMRVLADRLAPSRSRLSREVRTAHDEAAIAAGIASVLPVSDIVLVFGASAICDSDDVIPAAIRRLGGTIIRFGMPVDPGNLLLLGEIDGKPVIGAPGCARSPAENGFDWVLQRLIAGRVVSANEIAGMGVGGLLMEIGGRPQPREASKGPRRRIAAVILAAGRSTRMGANKLVATLDGRPVVAHVADAALASSAAEVVAVVGHEAERVRACLAGKALRFVDNPGHAGGLSTSLVAGIGAVCEDCDGAVVLLGDMPRISAAMIDRMIAAAEASAADAVIVATHGGRRGNPVLWPRCHFKRLMQATGDSGGRALIGELGDRVVAVELGEAAGFDLDTPAELAEAGGRTA